MSSAKPGKVAPFPPLPGQPFPPARNHPRWKELYRLHDEWMMAYWPFSSEKKRARIPFMNLAGFSTWCAPAADFDRMVWGGRIAGIFFLADDYIDSGKMLDRIPGFKKAATGTGPLHPEDRAEICHDIVFRAIKETSHPRTFDQLTKCTHEWWDSNIHEPFRNLDQYLATRRVNIAMYFANAYFRYTLDINLTDEQVNHPLMREAEGIVSDHVGLTNDFFSYAKEKLTNSDDTNILRMLQDHEGLTYEQAKVVVEKKIRQKEQDFIPAGMAVLNDPELGKDPAVRHWIACLPYCMGGNNAWSQESGRYNIGDVIGGVPFPKLSYEVEETPEDEVVDDTYESLLRDRIFNVKDIPEPDFTLDIDAIEGGHIRIVTQSALSAHYAVSKVIPPRPENVGIVAIEAYVPRQCFAIDGSTPQYRASLDIREDIYSVSLTTISALITKYAIDPLSIGRLEIVSETASTDGLSLTSVMADLFGEYDMEISYCADGPAAALVSAANWIESSSWDGRYVIVFAGDVTTEGAGAVALLVGANAPLIIEAAHGRFINNSSYYKSSAEDSVASYITALNGSYASYKRQWSRVYVKDTSTEPTPKTNGTNGVHTNGHHINGMNGSNGINGVNGVHAVNGVNGVHAVNGTNGTNGVHTNGDLTTKAAAATSEFEFNVFSTASTTNENFLKLPISDFNTRISPSLTLSRRCGDMGTASLFAGIASIVDSIPSYELFDKRISVFSHGHGATSSFFVLQMKGDTKRIRDTLDLSKRVEAMRVKGPAERAVSKLVYSNKQLPVTLELGPGTYYLESIDSERRRTYAVTSL